MTVRSSPPIRKSACPPPSESAEVRSDPHSAVFPRRLIDRLNRGQVSKPLHSVRLRLMPASDAVGEMVEFQNELIDHFELLLKPSPLDLAKEPPFFFKRKRGVQCGPSLFAVNLDKGSRLGAVARSSLANQTFGVCESKRDAVFDFAEALGVVSPGMRRRLDRGGARQPAHGVDAIDADVHQRTASRQPRVQLPRLRFSRVDEFGVSRKHVPETAKFAAGDQVLQGHTARLEILAISGHQVDPVLLACFHHAAAFFYCVAERLLAK